MNKENFSQKAAIAAVFVFSALLFALPALAYYTPQVQTSQATNIQNASATLNGNLIDFGGDYNATVWFQWGTSASYGYQTNQMNETSAGAFSTYLSNLSPNTTFHFRAVIQNQYGTGYGQDMVFTTSGSSGQVPVVNAGPNEYVAPGQSVVLQGSGYNPNGGSVTFSWTCNGGMLSNPTLLQPTYTAPNQNSQGSYICTLTGYDTNGGYASASTTVSINGSSSGNFYVQTQSPTNLFNGEGTLNGYVQGGAYVTSVWFQWGTNSGNYVYSTNQQQANYSGYFTQNIAGLSQGYTYHYRAVAESNGTIMYGQDMTFTSTGSTGSIGSSGNGLLSVTKTASNLSSGNLTYYSTVAANPLNMLRFSVTVQNGTNQDVHNVVIRDSLPQGLQYANNLTVSGISNYYGTDITSGITFSVIPAGQQVTLTYQTQVASPDSFNYGSTTLNNNVTVTSNEGGTETASANVLVIKSSVFGASSVSTGLTNNPLTDSFFIPLALLAGFFVFKSDIFKLKRKAVGKVHEVQLEKRIQEIRERETR